MRPPAIPSPTTDPRAPRWQRSLAEAIRDAGELLDMLEIATADRPALLARAAGFPLRVPRDLVRRMKKHDPRDPLLLQVLPVAAEDADEPGFGPDPVGDRAALAAPGLLRKYPGRALLLATATCAVHCRYCFRREYPYDDNPTGLRALAPALAYIAADPSLHEVILSGGDPLLLGDAALGDLIDALEAIPHVQRLRIHTRLPVVLPDRVGTDLVEILRATRLVPWVVIHSNHPAELEGECVRALRTLVEAGIPVLNQAVLLRGVNDDVETLTALCERLVDLRVQPYYLHQLDPVRGAAHFHVDIERGRELIAALRTRLPGYAVPRYVQEVPGAASKRLL